MEKTKKKLKGLSDKGFSLVELIVVIAIMAVLVGILAPTLIKNIEKSKESKDIANLESIRQAIVSTLSDESASSVIPTGGYSGTLANLRTSTTYVKFADVFNTLMTGDVKMTSSAAGTNAVQVIISSTGKVSVFVATNSTSTPVSCTKTKDGTGFAQLIVE